MAALVCVGVSLFLYIASSGFVTSLQKQLEGNIPDDQLWDSSSYLVGCVFESLRKMFTNARQIQVCLRMIVVHSACACVIHSTDSL